MSDEQMNDSTFNRLFILMILAMTVLTILLMVLATFASSDVNSRLDERSEVENTAALAERIAPVGQFAANTSAEPAVQAQPVVLTGAEAYASCAACHDAGVAGAPVTGDKAAWSDRIAQGIDTLYEHAIKGFQGSVGYMPAKGGNVSLSDESVKAAVDYMVEKAE
jgi:cytochrome c5